MEIFRSIYNLIFNVIDIVPPITASGIVEIIFFTFFIYKIIIWIIDTRAYNLLRGIFIIAAFVILSYVFQLRVIFDILKNASSVLITLLVIIFQSDIRKAIEKLGRYQWFKWLFSFNKTTQIRNDKEVSAICRSAFEMAKVKTGALIVIQQNDDLSKIIDTGIKINGAISIQLIKNIFEKNTPLHDGAIVIVNNIIVAATCYLPMSENLTISKNLGTRHRAALGISEVTDALTIIVSEETGDVSVAYRGQLNKISDEKLLANELYQTVYKAETQNNKNEILNIMKGWLNKNERYKKS